MLKIDGERDFIAVNIAVLTVSDSRTLKEDKSGTVLVNRIEKAGHKVAARDIVADEIGRYITPMISVSESSGGTFSRNCFMYLLFCNPMKSKHPDAISQNLDGIRKYAADWFIGYK